MHVYASIVECARACLLPTIWHIIVLISLTTTIDIINTILSPEILVTFKNLKALVFEAISSRKAISLVPHILQTHGINGSCTVSTRNSLQVDSLLVLYVAIQISYKALCYY